MQVQDTFNLWAFFIQSLFSWVVFAKYKLVTLFYLENLFIVSSVSIRCKKAFICCIVDFSLKACCYYLLALGLSVIAPCGEIFIVQFLWSQKWHSLYEGLSIALICKMKFINCWFIFSSDHDLNNHNIYMYLMVYLILCPPIYVVALKINPIKIYIFKNLETQE